jgi:hypothetical protein
MKRVFLTSDPADLTQRDPELVRRAAVALARYAVDADGSGHRDVGDPVHEEVTEGRYKQWLDAKARGEAWALKVFYSSCGDLPAWVLRCLGCRDESLVNRNDDGGEHPWAVGKNLQMLQGHPCTVKPANDVGPSPGDPTFVETTSGGHVCILDTWRETAPDEATSCDFGQPNGKLKKKKITAAPHLALDGHVVGWWLDITKVPLTESALVPNDFEGGVLDLNPYPEVGVPA